MENLSLDIIAALPLATLGIGVLILLIADLFRSGKDRSQLTVFSLSICVLSGVSSLYAYLFCGGHMGNAAPTALLNGLMYQDAFTLSLTLVILLGTGVTLMMNSDLLGEQRVKKSVDIDALVLLAACGAMVMVSAANMMVLFLGFELLSVAVYVLTGTARNEKASSEGALKYFILGAFSSAFLLYGMVLVYGVTGSMNLFEIGQLAAANAENPLLLVALGLIIFGFAFKVSLVPFHFWTPDVYQGAPTTLATFMAVVVKAAAFGAFLRVMSYGFGDLHAVWQGMLWVLAAVTMTVGNLAALRQKSIKRLLAYSSVAHAGYATIGLVAGPTGGWEATIFYLFVYSLMTIASFGVVALVSAGGDRQYDRDSIESLRGIGWSRPFLGLVMAAAVFSLAGMPPFAGFFGKLSLFTAAVKGGFTGLAIIAAINSVISLYYYLSILVVMYFAEAPEGERVTVPGGKHFAAQLAVFVATLGTLFTGLFAEGLFNGARAAAESISARNHSLPGTPVAKLEGGEQKKSCH